MVGAYFRPFLQVGQYWASQVPQLMAFDPKMKGLKAIILRTLEV